MQPKALWVLVAVVVLLVVAEAKRGGNRQRKQKGCKYDKSGDWGECDTGTNKQTRTLTLMEGSPPDCEATKSLERRCKGTSAKDKVRCKYDKSGEWSACDSETKKMARTMTLQKGNPDQCEATKVQEKPCKAGKCRYNWGQWSDCTEGKKTKSGTVIAGQDATCEATKELTKRCRNKAVKCKYDWQKWTGCVEGKKTKTGALMTGQPEACEATKELTKRCGANEGRKGRD